MNIAINCRSFLNQNYTGIGRYTFNLVKSLSELDQENRYLLYARQGIFHHNRGLSSLKFKNFSVKSDWLRLGPQRSLKDIDIYHSPSPENIQFNNHVKVIATVHDVIFKAFPEGHTPKAIQETEKNFQSFISKAAKIICCSKNTARDLQKYFSVADNKIATIYQGVDKNIFYMIGPEEEKWAFDILKSKGIEGAFILSVGTIEPRKNLKNILQAFHVLKSKGKFKGKLVVAGMKGWLSEDLEGVLNKLNLKKDVIFLGFLSDEELRCLYNKALAFVFPSFYEGFGFPIVEAFCCGVPVITSSISSCPEVAGDAAILVDPHNSEQIAFSLEHLLEDEDLRWSLRENGLKRAGDFSFLKTAQKTLEVYREVYKL